jgi:uncharacterized protein (DUF2249 family)
MKTAKQISIHAGTRIKTLLDADLHGVIEELVKLNINFAKLRNPVLRGLFANRVTIADACRITHCKVEDFLDKMRHIGFHTSSAPAESPVAITRKPINFNRTAHVHHLDARSYLENNLDPLKDILKMVNTMAAGERLKITNTFEPTPLISLLNDKGFSYEVEYIKEDLVITWFEKHDTTNQLTELESIAAVETDQQLFNAVLARFSPEQISYIDVRDLEMPQPMLLIMEHLDKLPFGGLLYVYHKKVPVFLLPELTKRGMEFSLNRHSASAVDMLIYRS